MVSKTFVFVRGLPAGLTAPARVAEPWKQAVAAAIATEWKGEYLSEACSIGLDFYLRPNRFRDSVLYNLLKSTIDGLSHTIFRSSPSGQAGPWSREDYWITQLTTTKQEATHSAGVGIQIGPCGQASEPAGELLVDIEMDGSPPLWPGDQAGQRRVLAWRERLCTLLDSRESLLPGTRLAIDLRFEIEPGRFNSSDLDNFVVPAAQATAHALTGGFGGARVIDEIRAAKEISTAGRYRTRVKIYRRMK